MLAPLRRFVQLEAAGGLVLMVATLAALLLANSPLTDSYQHLLHAPVAFGFNLHETIADGLMAIFFLAVGMELKYELREGHLAAPGQAILPLVAALGGVMVPALIYLAITASDPGLRQGWAIPTATDIAFALAVVKLAGKRVPESAKAFLLAIAIYDDLAAILIIAFFYAAGLQLIPLVAAAAYCLVLYALNSNGRIPLFCYLIVGIALWLALYHAGIHPTIAGVLTGLAIPLKRHDGTPLLRPFLDVLHPYVAFGIMPIFALASAGVSLQGVSAATLFTTLPLAIILGLLLGKVLGISGATFIALRLKLATAPAIPHLLLGIALVAGVGFTMSLFLGQLALPDVAQNSVRLGVLCGSLFSAVAGLLLLRSRPATTLVL